MNIFFVRDLIDCAVKIWTIFYFSSDMGKRNGPCWKKVFSLTVFASFVLLQRYVLSEQSLGEAFIRNVLLYFLTCLVMLVFREGQRQYLVFLASIVFFLWGGWLKLFTPMVFISLHLPSFGFALTDSFPLLPVTLAENICRVTAVVLMRKYAFDIDADRTVSVKEAFFALVPAAIDHTTVLILYYLTVVAPTSATIGIAGELTMLTLMLVFGMPCILAATEKQFQLKREEVRLLQMEAQMGRQVLEFEQRRLSDEQARKIYHDMNRHLSVLEEMARRPGDAGRVGEYVNDLLQEVREVTPEMHTGNAVLDTLLIQKMQRCSRDGIDFECMADLSRADFIRYADIVTMFSNVLDNAIEAVRMLPEEKRRIALSAGCIGEQIIVKCSNPYEGKQRKKSNGLYATTREEEALHGIGLGNVRRIVESYGGVFQAGEENGLFLTEWMIPLPVAG